MPFYTKENKTVQFMHIPKCAGSSVDHFFSQNNFKSSFISGLRKPCSLQHRHLGDKEFINKVNSYGEITYKFTFIRNPLDRIVSRFRMENKITDNVEILFHDFVINSIEGVKRDKYFKDNHFRHQKEFINEDITVFKFGEWDKFVKDVSEYVKIENKSFPHMFESSSPEFECLPETIKLVRDFYDEDFELWWNNS